MSATIKFHVAHLDSLFHIIGSADREILLDIGVTLGAEFRAPLDDEEDVFYGDDETDEPPEWSSDVEEADAAQEIVIKTIMSSLPHDLSEDEAYAVQDFFASYAHRSDEVHLIEPDDLYDQVLETHDEEAAAAVQELLLLNVGNEEIADLVAWLEANNASYDLLHRVEMIAMGRLPEFDEPTFTDLEDEAYSPRFAYLHGSEIIAIVDEMNELAPRSMEDIGPIAYLVGAVMKYCASNARDLVVTIDE